MMKKGIPLHFLLLLVPTLCCMKERNTDDTSSRKDEKTIVRAKNDIQEKISEILPAGWTVTAKGDVELIIQSAEIRLQTDPMSNDPLGPLYGPCIITVLILDRIPPEGIEVVRKRNAELMDGLSPQKSKDNLKQWHKDNADVLNIIHSQPTHYDDEFSYRIECRRTPYEEPARGEYARILEVLNTMFTAYPK